MPENTEYVELDISSLALQLNPYMLIDVTYYTYSSVAMTKNTRYSARMRSYSEALPEGYVIMGVAKISLTSTGYTQDTTQSTGKRNCNDISYTMASQLYPGFGPGATEIPELIDIYLKEDVQSGRRNYIERTVTFLAAPEDCMPVTEE